VKLSASKGGNFWLGVSISRQTTIPLLVLVGFGWVTVSAWFGTPAADMREKRARK
jgi:hypothetical protein